MKKFEDDVMIKVFVDYSATVNADTVSVNSADSDVSRYSIHNAVYDDLIQEVQVIRRLYHEHIVLFYDEIDMKGIYGYVMEYCKRGNLHDYIVNNGPMTEKQIQVFLKQMLSALAYLSEQRVVHRWDSFFSLTSRDIKTMNVLIYKDDYYKLCDFGSSAVIKVVSVLVDYL